MENLTIDTKLATGLAIIAIGITIMLVAVPIAIDVFKTGTAGKLGIIAVYLSSGYMLMRYGKKFRDT